MSQVNARALHLSKWAAGLSGTCILEAVISRRRIKLDCLELNDSEKWRVGWR